MEDVFASLKEMEWNGIIPEEDIISTPKEIYGLLISKGLKAYYQYNKRNEEWRRKISANMQGNKNQVGSTKQRRIWKITFSNGKSVIVWGLRPWCKENNYSVGTLMSVKNGKRKKHKDIVAVEKLDNIPRLNT